MDLKFHLWGAGKPRTLVLLHGMGGTGALWRGIAAGLEDEFQILAPDQRGHGESQASHLGHAPELYTPEAYGRDVVTLVEKQVQAPVLWVGHSMGARTAAAAAALRPDLTRGLVLVDLGFEGPAGGGLGDTLARFLREIPSGYASRAEARTQLLETCPDPSIGRYLAAVLQADPAQPGAVKFPFDRDALLATIEAARGTEFRSKVRALADAGAPVLALRGETSTVWSREDFEREQDHFRDRLQVTFREFQGTGHGLPFEKREAFIQCLKEQWDAG